MFWYFLVAGTLMWLPYVLLVVVVFFRLKLKQLPTLTTYPPVSVIVAFRNESENLPALIDALKKQNYPNSKFVLINDHSEDHGLLLANKLTQTDSRFSVITPPLEITGKKGAIKEGINHAGTPLVFFTDADCRPNPNWISAMVGAIYQTRSEFISGTVLIHPSKHFFERLQAVELNYLVAFGHGLIDLGYPLLCNGASMLITDKIAQLPVNSRYASGDDIFRLHESFSRGFKINYQNHPTAHVYTKAESTPRTWFQQRLRWAAKTTAYTPLFAKVLSAVIALGQAGIILLLFVLPIWLWAIFFSLKVAVETAFMLKAKRTYQQEFSLSEIILVGVVYPAISIIIAISTLITKPVWKGRKLL